MLLLALDDPHRKICTAIGMAVASIAMYDWPELWSDLLPFLLNLINNQTNLNGGKQFIMRIRVGDLWDFYTTRLKLWLIVEKPQVKVGLVEFIQNIIS